SDQVGRNAVGQPAGCDGLVMTGIDEDRECNRRRRAESLPPGTIRACPVRWMSIPKPNGRELSKNSLTCALALRHANCVFFLDAEVAPEKSRRPEMAASPAEDRESVPSASRWCVRTESHNLSIIVKSCVPVML